MSQLNKLTEADVRQMLTSKIRSRATGYLNHIEKPVRRGSQLIATVGKGTKYRVEIYAGGDDIAASCTCPYDWGGHCKHIGALLLYWVHYRKQFDDQTGHAIPSLELRRVGARKSHIPDKSPYWVGETFAQRQDQAHTKLRAGLYNEVVKTLRDIGLARGRRVKGAKKDDILDRLLERLLDPAESLTVYQTLSDAEQAFFKTLFLAKPSRLWNDDKLQQTMRQWSKQSNDVNLWDLARSLHQKGLALSSDAAWNESKTRYGVIPPILVRNLLPTLPPLLAIHETPVADEILLADNRAFVRSANQLVRLIVQSKPKLNDPQPRPKLERFYKGLKHWAYDSAELIRLKGTGKLNSSQMPAMSVPPLQYSFVDDTLASAAGGQVRLEWLYHLMISVGVLRPGTPVKLWETHQLAFHQQLEAQQQAHFVRAYCKLTTWHEFWDILHAEPTLRLQRKPIESYKPVDFNAEIIELRQLVLNALATLPNDCWVSLPALTALLRRMWRSFSASEFRPNYHHYGQTSGKPLWWVEHEGKSADKWSLAHKRFVQQILQVLHWLGVADLGLRNGQIDAFRLQGFGDLYFERAEYVVSESEVASADALTAEGNTLYVNPSAVGSQAHQFLDGVARLDKAQPDEFVYQLDSQAVHETFEDGTSLTQLLEQWQSHFNNPPPNAITTQLTTWWETYGQHRIYQNVTLIEFADEFALTEMKAVTELKRHIIAELSPTLVIISKSAVDLLSTQLQQAGYTPKLTDKPD